MTQPRKLLTLAYLGWLASFFVLRQLGTWLPFAFVGVLLTALIVQSTAVPLVDFRPSARSWLMGAGAGMVMVLATHLAYGWLSAAFPAVRTETLELFSRLKVVGVSARARAALIVVIASCEEVLFRGLLPDSTRGTPPRARWPRGQELRAITGWSVVYALTTLPLGSPLLVLCAFACGTVWGALRVATGSLLVPILAHVLWDLGVLIVWPLLP